MVVQNLGLAKQELEPLRGGDSLKFQSAISEKKIVNSDVENAKEALRYAMVKIGLRAQNWPSEEEKSILLDHVLRLYGGHTASEIRLAFDMAIEGKLEVEVNCYENFSCMYFSNIMNTYRIWAVQEYNQIPKQLPQIEYKEDMSPEAMQEWFQSTSEKIKAGQMRIEFVPPMLYEWLDSNGNISATKELKYEYLNRASEYRLGVLRENLEKDDSASNRLSLSTFVTMKNNGCIEGREASIVKTLAKQILLFEMILNK